MNTLITTDYGIARDRLSDGDVIVLRAGWFHSPLACATRLLLRTPYTHSAVMLWLEGGAWVTEIRGQGSRLVPLSWYADEAWDAFACPVENRQRVRHAFLERLRWQTSYDIGDLLLIAWYRITGLKRREHDDDDLVCSSYSIQGLVDAGWHSPLPVLSAPDELAKALGHPLVGYRPENGQ